MIWVIKNLLHKVIKAIILPKNIFVTIIQCLYILNLALSWPAFFEGASVVTVLFVSGYLLLGLPELLVDIWKRTRELEFNHTFMGRVTFPRMIKYEIRLALGT